MGPAGPDGPLRFRWGQRHGSGPGRVVLTVEMNEECAVIGSNGYDKEVHFFWLQYVVIIYKL